MNNVFICGNCGNDKLDVVDSRNADGVRRRRKRCPICDNRFTTYEIDEEDYKKYKANPEEIKKSEQILQKLNELLEEFV